MALQITCSTSGRSADYAPYLFTLPNKTDRINEPDYMDFSVVPSDGSFIKLVRGDYVTFTTTKYGVWYTGYVTNDAELEYLGHLNGQTFYGFKYKLTADDYILNLNPIPIMPPFINQTMGGIIKSLVGILAPQASFDLTGVQNGLTVAEWVPDPNQHFYDVVKSFADSAAYTYNCRNNKITFAAQDSTPAAITIDGNDQHFTPTNLKLQASTDQIINDAIVVGDIEANNYMTEYFVGDGFTTKWPLASSVFGVDSAVLLDDTFQDSQINTNNWTMFDDPANYFQVFNGYMNVLGGRNDGTYGVWMQSTNLIPLEGTIRATHGEWDFISASDGIIGGFWTQNPSAALTGCVYGIRVTKSGSNTVLQPIVNGTVDSTQSVTISNYSYRYLIRTIAQFGATPRYLQEYAYINSNGAWTSVGGQGIASQVTYTTWIAIVDPTTGALLSTTPNTYQWTNTASLNNTTLYAYYDPVVDNDMHCTFSNVTISLPIQAALGLWRRWKANTNVIVGETYHPTTFNGHAYQCVAAGTTSATTEPTWPTASAGTVVDGSVTWKEVGTNPVFTPYLIDVNDMDTLDGMAPAATIIDANQGWSTRQTKLGRDQYNPGNAALEWITDPVLASNNQAQVNVPQVGDIIQLQYRRAAAAIARVQDPVSIAGEAAAFGDDGLRSILRMDLQPAPRNAAECELAGQAIVGDFGRQHWDGTYKQYSLYSFTAEPKAGTVLHFQNLPSSFPSSLTYEVIQEVQSQMIHSVGSNEIWEHTIKFGRKDGLKKALAAFTKQVNTTQTSMYTQDTASLPQAIDINAVGLAFAPDVVQPTITSWDVNNIYYAINQAPPSGGGFEVRYTDDGWGCDDGFNLVARQTSQTFSVPRTARGRIVFVRAYDGRNKMLYSEDLTNAAWAKSSATVANKTILNPLENQQLISAVTASVGGATISQSTSGTFAAGNAECSVSIQAPAGKTVTVQLLSGASVVAQKTVTMTGRWQRITVSGTTVSTATLGMNIIMNQAAAFNITWASLEVGTLTETVYCKTKSTAYGATSRYAAGLRDALPLNPPAPTVTIDYSNPVAPVLTITLPTVAMDVWGIQISSTLAERNNAVLYKSDLSDIGYTGKFADTGNRQINLDYSLSSYNLLNEFSSSPTVVAVVNPFITKGPDGFNIVSNGSFEKNTYGCTLNQFMSYDGDILIDEWYVL